jgi:hypothetical protein
MVETPSMKILRRRYDNLDKTEKKAKQIEPKDSWGKKEKQRILYDIAKKKGVVAKEYRIREEFYKAPTDKKRQEAARKYAALKKKNTQYYQNSGSVADVCAKCSADDLKQLQDFYDKGTAKYSVDEYKKKFAKTKGRPMTPHEEKLLSYGCVGITAVNIGHSDLRTPDLSESFATLSQALKRKQELEKQTGKKAILFSMRFWKGGQPYSPDPNTGKINMSGYNYIPKPNPNTRGTYTNFDYGYYDPATDSWWHANNAEPGMEVYRSTKTYYSRPLADFDGQVYSIAFPP